MDRVKDKVAIVTGGANGIGEATARLLAREGARVAIVDIDDENGKRVAAEIKAAKGMADFWHLDISKEEEVKKIFTDILGKYGKLHILVNNAGIPGHRKPAHETTSEEFDRIMNVNLKGAFFCTKYAAPYMIKSGIGSIVNIASIYGIIGCDTPDYDTSKGALRAMTKSDALIYAKSNIRVNSVHPGNIITPLFRKLVEKIGGGLENTIKLLSTMCPMDRMGYPEEVAQGILFLASDESSYVTAAELLIDGGMFNAPPPKYPDTE
ncbi:MAG: short-chain dehydrogenase [Chloroflexi bacterium RBG_16_56_11]|nr:MAG: short-chain dehydrogenase [Chloroflexi bacterium RBG_16_56_11]